MLCCVVPSGAVRCGVTFAAGGQGLPGGGVADEASGEPPHGPHQGRPPQHEVGVAGELV